MKKEHICVCICTYRRPHLLKNLLEELKVQKTDNLFTYSIIVVDNDYNHSAKSIVIESIKESSIMINYYVEPIKNIAIARNKAVLNAEGDFIAFIDDDEIPANNWLYNLYYTFLEHNADGILGPVKPKFEKAPPKWIIKGQFCERFTPQTGSIVSMKDTRTGNVLLRRNIFDETENLFDPEFKRGSDKFFFTNLIKKGYIFLSCREAPVYEIVPPERLEKKYFLRRALLYGTISSRYFKNNSFVFATTSVVKSLIAIFLYTFSLPFLYMIGNHVFMKYLIKDCHHLGRLLSIFGIKVISEKKF